MKNIVAFVLSVIVAVVPQLLEMFDAYPKVKVALSVVGVVMAAILVQLGKLPEQKKDTGSARLGPLCFLASFGAFVGFLTMAVYLNGCATTGPGRFVDVVVECGEDAVAKNPTVAANVRTCLLGLTGGGYVQCISLLPFTVDEITCVIAELSRGASKAVNTGDANPEEYTILRNANDWLKQNHVGIKRAP